MCGLHSPGFCSSAHFHPKTTFFPQFRAVRVHKSKDFLNLTNQACKSPVIILTFKSIGATPFGFSSLVGVVSKSCR